MILTVTPNPSVDRTITVDLLVRGVVHRAIASRQDPGGKGLNVSRALVLNAVATQAVLPVGGDSGRMMVDLLAEAGVVTRPVPVSDAIRANVAIVEPNGTTTKINEPGPELSARECRALLDEVRIAASQKPGWVVGSGSLPPGMPRDFYAELISVGREFGARVAIDSSGDALAAALAGGPDLVKPNRAELAEVFDADLDTMDAVHDAAKELIGSGIGSVLVSLGRDGALLVTPDGAWHAAAIVESPVSTVGAGDALLAGFLAASERGLSEPLALRLAAGFGAAAVLLPGSEMPDPEQVDAVTVRLSATVNHGLRLSD